MAAAMSPDGYIADQDGNPGPLFDWYGNGDVEYAPGDPERPFRVSRASADYLRATWPKIRTVVIGRRLFDQTNGWHGRPSAGESVFVVTHQQPVDWEYLDTAPFTFVTEGVESAITQARAAAGEDGVVSLTAGDVGAQALEAGLVDEIAVALVPVVFGSGVKFFGEYAKGSLLLENPSLVVQGDRVTHLHFPVRR